MLHIEVEFVVQEDSGNWCLLHLGKWSHRWSNWSQPDTSHRKKKENRKFCWKIVKISWIRFFSCSQSDGKSYTCSVMDCFQYHPTVKARIGNQ